MQSTTEILKYQAHGIQNQYNQFKKKIKQGELFP